MPPKRQTDADRKAESDRILDGVARDSETVGASSARRAADRARGHFMGSDAEKDDRVEVWGRRVGRLLSLAFLVGLVWYMAVTYL
jgi:hypothetical protein